jgi:hypothetical protein
MKASKFSEAQIAFVLKQAEDGSAVAEVWDQRGLAQEICGPAALGDEAAASARGRE